MVSLIVSLPECEKKSCAWDLQLQKHVAGLLNLYELGRYIPFSCKQPNKIVPHIPPVYEPKSD
jgi:hypothetical protein